MPYAEQPGYLSAYGEYTAEPQPSKQEASDIREQFPSASIPQDTQTSSRISWITADFGLTFPLSQNKPVMLHVREVTSHWCNMMNKDCFNDIETTSMMADTVIPVISDRVLNPALDVIMTIACRLQNNGTAGYPLNVFMTQEGMPFFCTTWLPKRTMGQMTGLTEILPRIKWLWSVQHDDVERSANDLHTMMLAYMEAVAGTKHKSSGRIGTFTAYQAFSDMRTVFDIRWGGFGASPKYPEPDKLIYLLNYCLAESGVSKHDQADSLTMTDITLRRMWRGAIHDQLGGGFFASSAGSHWLIPRFEKPLSLQAGMLLSASLSQRVQENSFHRLLAEDVIFSLTKDFADNSTHSQGFVAGIDGDTADGEGRYYLWNESEIKRILPEDGGLFCAAYGVLPSGNFGSELAGAQLSWNVLYEASTVTELSKRYGLTGADVSAKLYNARKTLLDYRDKRYPLKADSKILMNSNGLTIGALAHASVSFNVKEWLEIAERTALFITRNFKDKSGKWMRAWIDGKIYIPVIADDLAGLLWGIVEVYKAAKHFEAGEKQLGEWADVARTLADTLIADFGDESGGLFQSTAPILPSLPRLKSPEDYNSLPSYNALAAIALCELAFILEDRKYSDFARGIIGCFAHYVRENPLMCLTMITADMSYRAFKPKKKPEPEAKPVPTDEELNREEPQDSPPEDDKKPARASRRSTRQEASSAGRNERTTRRSARPHRTRER